MRKMWHISLAGLFGVSIPVLYGEGQRAFIKLQEEIIKETEDASIYAWTAGDGQQFGGLARLSGRPVRALSPCSLHLDGSTLHSRRYIQHIGRIHSNT